MRNVRVVTASYAILMALPVMFGLGIVAGVHFFWQHVSSTLAAAIG